MTVKSIEKDTVRLTMRLTAEFDAPVGRVWSLWEDPRQLERWWGPPGYPATFVDHDFRKGGGVKYYMTSPDGEKYYGWWQITDLTATHGLEFVDGFGDSDGNPDPEMPTTTTVVSLEPHDGRTVMTLESRFASIEAMEQMVEMGMEEGLTLAVGQIDEILSEDVSSEATS